MRARLLLLAVVISLTGCFRSNDPIIEELKEVKTIGDFKGIRSVTWDEIYIYGPYQNLTEILNEHGLTKTDIEERKSSVIDDSECLIIMKKNSLFIKAVFVKRSDVDLANFTAYSPIKVRK